MGIVIGSGERIQIKVGIVKGRLRLQCLDQGQTIVEKAKEKRGGLYKMGKVELEN